jgi:hypothetical protein
VSLTSHLNDPKSPVLAFMRERFPNTRGLAGRLNRELKGLATIQPPEWAGYPRDVGGTAADLIVDGYLIEIKTLATPKITGKMLHQLLGYVFLDYEGEHPLTQAGFYLARQTSLKRMPLSDLLGELSGDGDIDLPKTRKLFRDAALRGGAQRRE